MVNWLPNLQLAVIMGEAMPTALDFAVKIPSPTESLAETQSKMEEYTTNGTRLGWLIDRANRIVCIYRSDLATPEILYDSQTVSGDSELPGFILL